MVFRLKSSIHIYNTIVFMFTFAKLIKGIYIYPSTTPFFETLVSVQEQNLC